MKRYVGIDVAQKECALCIVGDAGTILFEGASATEGHTAVLFETVPGHQPRQR